MATPKLSKYKFYSNTTLWITGSILLLITGTLNLNIIKPVLNLKKQDTAINVNNKVLVFFNAGNKRLITDLLWVQTLIESDVEHYSNRDLNNWLFLRFNSISLLDPLFYENYLYGGQFLAIVKDDLEGANIIYEKGLRVYPDDYLLNFNAGFLNYYEIGDYKKGLKYLENITEHEKAPLYLKSIVHKLKVATGVQLPEVYNLVLLNYKTTKEETLRKRLAADLYAIKAEIDLVCLNNNLDGCSYVDFEGNSYIRKNNQFYSSKTFLRYQINKREANPLPSEEKRINFLK